MSCRADLLEHLQPFAGDRGIRIVEARDVAAWPSQASDEAGADRIGDKKCEYDRNVAGHLRQTVNLAVLIGLISASSYG